MLGARTLPGAGREDAAGYRSSGSCRGPVERILPRTGRADPAADRSSGSCRVPESLPACVSAPPSDAVSGLRTIRSSCAPDRACRTPVRFREVRAVRGQPIGVWGPGVDNRPARCGRIARSCGRGGRERGDRPDRETTTSSVTDGVRTTTSCVFGVDADQPTAYRSPGRQIRPRRPHAPSPARPPVASGPQDHLGTQPTTRDPRSYRCRIRAGTEEERHRWLEQPGRPP